MIHTSGKIICVFKTESKIVSGQGLTRESKNAKTQAYDSLREKEKIVMRYEEIKVVNNAQE